MKHFMADEEWDEYEKKDWVAEVAWNENGDYFNFAGSAGRLVPVPL